MSIIRKEQLTNPLSASYALTASYVENASTTFNTSSLVTTSSFNAFTASINTFTSSYNTGSFSGSFSGNINGTASWAEYVVNGGNIDTSALATTSSNTFIGNQIISGSGTSFSSSLLITNPNDAQWGIGLNNRSFTPIISSRGPHLGIWIQNDGQAFLGTEYGQTLNIYSNITNEYSHPAIKVTGSNALITGSLFGTSSTASYYQEIDPIFTAKSASLATTGSNTFIGNQTISGSIYLGSGSIISESGSTTIITPPGALPGQSLVLRPTQTWNLISDHPTGFTPGDLITITFTPNIGGAYTFTASYTFTDCTEVQLGRSLTGSLDYVLEESKSLSWTIPSISDITSFTFTIENVAFPLSPNPFITLTRTGSISNEPSHLHLISGNPATTDIYLGDDDQYIKIEKNAGNVVIGTNLDTYQWIFDTSSLLTAPGRINAPSFSGSFTGSLFGTSSWGQSASQAISSSYTLTASYLNTLNQDLTLSGSLTILNNLTIFGTQSVVYITSSQLDISTNIITVNTSTPAVRFGGLAVKDSGSLATGRTGSLLWDSEHNVWIYSNPSGALYDGGLLLTGPRNASGIGNEVGINSGYAAVGDGSHHMTSSAIYSSGSLIRLENNTQITGSLNVSSGITGSLFGTSSWATNARTASYILSSDVYGFAGPNSIQSALAANTAGTLTIFASIDQINVGNSSDVFIRPNELEQSKYAALNIYNYNNFT